MQAALNSITDASATKPYLVYVAAGVYTEQVTLKPFVTLEGAGEGVTILRWTGGSNFPLFGGGSATLRGATNSGARLLSVESDGAGQDFAVPIYSYYNDGSSPTLRQVTASAWGEPSTTACSTATPRRRSEIQRSRGRRTASTAT